MTALSIPNTAPSRRERVEWNITITGTLRRRVGDDIELEGVDLATLLYTDLPNDLVVVEWHGKHVPFDARRFSWSQTRRGITVEQAAEHVGELVEYIPEGQGREAVERGQIVRAGAALVFVRYGANGTPQGTPPERLSFIWPRGALA